MKHTPGSPSTQKVRREVVEGKRGDGRALQQQGVQRFRPAPDMLRLQSSPRDAGLTQLAGLVPFGIFARHQELDRALDRAFDRLKTGSVVFPMGPQLRPLIDAAAVGEARVFGLEALAADPLFVRLAGGRLASLDIFCDDLARFDGLVTRELDLVVSNWGMRPLQERTWKVFHLDLDSIVEVVFGQQEGALPGPNPRYRGRPGCLRSCSAWSRRAPYWEPCCVQAIQVSVRPMYLSWHNEIQAQNSGAK